MPICPPEARKMMTEMLFAKLNMMAKTRMMPSMNVTKLTDNHGSKR